MKVVCLGAAGGMGSRAAQELAKVPGIDRLVLADRARVGQVDTEVDVTDANALRRVLSDADLVLNCTGPFFRFGVPVLEAAIDTATMYMDICDDPEPSLAMFALDQRAKDAGVGALIGMGASPGLSNLLAARAARHLDSVTDCYTVWPLDVPSPGQEGATMDEGRDANGRPSAAVVHLMEQISGAIAVVERGRRQHRAPLEPIALDYPGGGSGTAYTVGHPEPLTLHVSLGITGQAANAMLVRRSTAPYLAAIGRDIDRGRLTHADAAEAVLSPRPARLLRALLASARFKGAGSLPGFFVLLRGEREGQSLTVACRLTSTPAGMAAATAVPAVLAITQLLDQPLPPGVHPPETTIDGERLLTDLLPHCGGAFASLDELAPVTEAGANATNPGNRTNEHDQQEPR